MDAPFRPVVATSKPIAGRGARGPADCAADGLASSKPGFSIRRDGTWSPVPAKRLVPGDVIRLRLGDVIPADARLLEGGPVEIDQSALTGESLPVTHQAGEDVYSGSVMKQGEADAVV